MGNHLLLISLFFIGGVAYTFYVYREQSDDWWSWMLCPWLIMFLLFLFSNSILVVLLIGSANNGFQLVCASFFCGQLLTFAGVEIYKGVKYVRQLPETKGVPDDKQ